MNSVNTKHYDPFTTQFVIKQFDNPEYDKILETVLLQESENWTGHRPRGKYISGMQTARRNLLDDSRLHELEQELISITQDYFNINSHLKRPDRVNFETWGNILHNNSFHPAHAHGQAKLVINYYIKTPKDSRIMFLAPDVINQNPTSGDMGEHIIYVKQGMLVASPPWLNHEVFPPGTDELRMSISTNVI